MKRKNIFMLILTLLLILPISHADDFKTSDKIKISNIVDDKDIIKYDKEISKYKDDIKKDKIIKAEKTDKIYKNKYGMVKRDNITDAKIKIQDKLISVENYDKINKSFQVVLYTGTNGVDYSILRSDKFTSYEDVSKFGDYIGTVTSIDGFVTYNTSAFSTQILTLPLGALWYPVSFQRDISNYFENYEYVELFYYDGDTKISLEADSSMNDNTQTDTSGPLDMELTRVLSGSLDTFLFEFSAPNTNTFYDGYYYIKVCENTAGTTGCITRSAPMSTYSDSSAPVKYDTVSDIALDYEDIEIIIYNNYFRNFDRACILIDTVTECVDKFTTQTQTISEPEYTIELQAYINGLIVLDIITNDNSLYYNEDVNIYTINTQYDDTITTDDTFNLEIGVAGSPPTSSIIFNREIYENDNILINFNNHFNDYDEIRLQTTSGCDISVQEGINNDEVACSSANIEYVLFPSDNYIILSIESLGGLVSDTVTITAYNDYGNTQLLFDVDIIEFTGGSSSISDGLVYYTFDTGCSDSSGNGNNCVLEGTSNIQSTTAKLNNAVETLGSDYITLPNGIGDFTGAEDFTINFWFYNTNYPSDTKLLSLYEDSSVRFYTKSSVLYYNIYNGGHVEVTYPGLTTNTWYQATGIFNSGDNMSLYINGAFVGSTPITDTTLQVRDEANYIAREINTYWGGYIDEFSIWQKALNEDEIESLYNSGDAFNPYTSIPQQPTVNHDAGVTINNTINDILMSKNDYVEIDTHLYFDNYDRFLFQIVYNGSVVGRQIEFISSEYQTLTVNDVTFTLVNEIDNIYLNIESKEKGLDTYMIITAYNDNFSNSQELNLFVDGYFNPVDAINDANLVNISRAYDDEYILLMNDYFINYQYIEMTFTDQYTNQEFSFNVSIDDNETQSYYRDGYYNISAYNDNGHIKIKFNSYSNDLQQQVSFVLRGCNVWGCVNYHQEDISGYYVISETGDYNPIESTLPPWITEPKDEYKPFYALLIIIGVTLVAGLGTARESYLSGAVFGSVAGVGAFLLLTYMGWIPVMYLIILLLIIAGVIAYVIKGAFT